MRTSHGSAFALVVLASLGCREPATPPDDALADASTADSPTDTSTDAPAQPDVALDATPRDVPIAPDEGPATDAPLTDNPTPVDSPRDDAPVEDTPGVDASSDVAPSDDIVPLPDVPAPDVPAPDVRVADVPLTDASGIAAPRARAPLSGAHVPSRRPTLRWTLPTGTDGARVTLCRDHALRTGCVTFDATGTSGAPGADLASGLWHWSVRGLSSGVAGSAATPVWRMRIASTSIPSARPWGADPDLNGDGYADVIYGVAETSVRVHLGGAEPGPAIVFNAPIDSTHFGAALDYAGDIDGDGYGDLIVGASGSDQVLLYPGSDAGPIATPTTVTGPRGSSLGASVAGAGDVNGDGFDDVVALSTASNTVWYFAGSATGLGAPTRIVLPTSPPMAGVGGLGDVNGDGFADVLLTSMDGNDGKVLFGASTGLDLARGVSTAFTSRAVGDMNGDGFADVAQAQNVIYGAATYPGRSSVLSYPNPLVSAHGGDFNGDGCDDTLGSDVFFAGTPSGANGPYPLVTGFGTAPYTNSVGAGDVDGDGYDDLLTSARDSNTLHLTRGGSGPLFGTFLFTPFGSGVSFTRAASAGDLDGDHHADLLLGLSAHRGSAAGIAGTPTWTFATSSSYFSPTSLGVGDLNRDGFTDLVYAASTLSTSGSRQAIARLGSASGPGATQHPLSAEYMGFCEQAFVPLGDVNGDRYDDVACGTYIGYGGPAPTALASTALPRNLSDPRALGDINHDGFADLSVQVLDGPSNTYSAGLIYGSAGPLSLSSATFPRGTRIVGAGDVNGDHYDDAVLSFYTSAMPAELRLGSASGLSTTALLTTTLPSAGLSSPVGDLNHDGYDELLWTGGLCFGSAAGPVVSAPLSWGGGGTLVTALSVRGDGDVDGDGVTDLIFTNQYGIVVQRFTTPQPRHFVFTPPTGAPALGYR